MREYVELGPVPSEEACAQVGTDEYAHRARAECLAYITLIRQVCGEEPEGARLSIKSFAHDFGSYLEVVCYYNHDDEASMDYAYRIEQDAPTVWTA